MSILEIYNPILHPDGFWHSLRMDKPRDSQQIWNGQTRAVSGLASTLNVVLLACPAGRLTVLFSPGTSLPGLPQAQLPEGMALPNQCSPLVVSGAGLE